MSWQLFWQIVMLIVLCAMLFSLLHYDFLQDKLKYEAQRRELDRKGRL